MTPARPPSRRSLIGEHVRVAGGSPSKAWLPQSRPGRIANGEDRESRRDGAAPESPPRRPGGVAAVRFHAVGKRFPGVHALIDVSFSVHAGTCHGLVGENGAGKSTLGKILAGITVPDSGTVTVLGKPVRLRTPRDAMAAGIAMVHQELLFCENLTVAENLCLDSLPSRGPFLSRSRMAALARGCLARLNAGVDPDRTVSELTISQQQIVQIAAAVARGARVLILDEPTSSLSQRETESLLQLLAALRREGVTLIYISHRLPEIFRICDRVTVLRDGRAVATGAVRQHDEDALVRLMIGRAVQAYFPGHLHTGVGEELLRVEGLARLGRFGPVSFSLRAGEVLGLAGLMGAGRTEILEALFGLGGRTTGRVLLRGREVRFRNPRQAFRSGLGLIPEDRKRHGLVLSMNARENITLPILRTASRWGWVQRAAERGIASEYFCKLAIRAPDIDAPAAGLSGGNQQKLVIARWLAARCGILLVDEPTRGIDVGAKAEIHGLIDRLAQSGAAVLLASSELPEVMNLSTRILVLRHGRIVGELRRGDADPERVLRLMAGVRHRP